MQQSLEQEVRQERARLDLRHRRNILITLAAIVTLNLLIFAASLYLIATLRADLNRLDATVNGQGFLDGGIRGELNQLQDCFTYPKSC